MQGWMLPRIHPVVSGRCRPCGALIRDALFRKCADPMARHMPATMRASSSVLVERMQSAPPSFEFAVLQAPLMKSAAPPNKLPPNLQTYASRLESLGGTTGRPGSTPTDACAIAQTAAERGLPLVLLVGTGGTEALTLQAVNAYHEAYWEVHSPGKLDGGGGVGPYPPPLPPLLLLAHPYANSLPAALETLAKLQQDGLTGRIVCLPSAESWDTSKLQNSLQYVHVWHQLHATRIGLVGTPSPWLVASVPSKEVLRSAWGPSLMDVPMEELMNPLAADEFDPGEVEQVVEDMLRGSRGGGCLQCGHSLDAAPAAKTYLALREVVRRHALRCLSVRCFDIVTGEGTTGCYALARLLDEGVIAGCEGDVCTTLSMLWAHLMTGQVPWMANVAQADPVCSTLTLAHCTVARSLLSSCETNTHFESGKGVALQGHMPPGPVTLLRIGGKGLERLWVEEGEILDREADSRGKWSPELCRTQVRVQLKCGQEKGGVERLLQRPLGNHVVLLRGQQKAWLEGYWRELGPGAHMA